MSTRQGARFGLPGSGGRADAVDGAPDSPDEFADAEQGLAGSPAASTMGAFAAAAALHSPAPGAPAPPPAVNALFSVPRHTIYHVAWQRPAMCFLWA